MHVLLDSTRLVLDVAFEKQNEDVFVPCYLITYTQKFSVTPSTSSPLEISFRTIKLSLIQK